MVYKARSYNTTNVGGQFVVREARCFYASRITGKPAIINCYEKTWLFKLLPCRPNKAANSMTAGSHITNTVYVNGKKHSCTVISRINNQYITHM